MTDLKYVLDAADAGLEQSLDRLFASRAHSHRSRPIPPIRPNAARLPNGSSPISPALGFYASLRETPGQPMVVAHIEPEGAQGKVPHVLVLRPLRRAAGRSAREMDDAPL